VPAAGIETATPDKVLLWVAESALALVTALRRDRPICPAASHGFL